MAYPIQRLRFNRDAFGNTVNWAVSWGVGNTVNWAVSWGVGNTVNWAVSWGVGNTVNWAVSWGVGNTVNWAVSWGVGNTVNWAVSWGVGNTVNWAVSWGVGNITLQYWTKEAFVSGEPPCSTAKKPNDKWQINLGFVLVSSSCMYVDKIWNKLSLINLNPIFLPRIVF